MRLAFEQQHQVVVHPATRDDLLEGRDPSRRAQRLAELRKFPLLSDVKIASSLVDVLGAPRQGSNDHRDMRLLAALHNNAATYLVSDDAALRKRAARVHLGERVLTLVDAVEMLRQLTPTVSTPPPRVRSLEPYALDSEQPIFDSLRLDYGGFDQWLDERVRPDIANRDCFVVEEHGLYAALAIVKRFEVDCPYQFNQPVSKLATFKVSSDYVGSKYGELLLKAAFAAARARKIHSLYVEVLPKHDTLVDLLANFGFRDSGLRTDRGELVLTKDLVPTEHADRIDPLAYHITYGPPAIAGTGGVFIVPIRPEWHRQLFPDSPDPGHGTDGQLALVSESDLSSSTHPWGNALRKAYLSNSGTQKVSAGSTLLFYRSGGPRCVAAIGVAEATLRSADPAEVMAFVGRRTVYTPAEIAAMCRCVGGVLAILFRQDRFIDPGWGLDELHAHGVVRGWPQSITQVGEAGAQWVHSQLTE